MLKFFAEKMWVAFAMQKLLTFFSAKKIRILSIESAKTCNEMTLNELVKLMTLWTTEPISYVSLTSLITTVDVFNFTVHFINLGVSRFSFASCTGSDILIDPLSTNHNYSIQHFGIFYFFIFLRKQDDISCESSAWFTWNVTLFSLKNNKINFGMLSATNQVHLRGFDTLDGYATIFTRETTFVTSSSAFLHKPLL